MDSNEPEIPLQCLTIKYKIVVAKVPMRRLQIAVQVGITRAVLSLLRLGMPTPTLSLQSRNVYAQQ